MTRNESIITGESKKTHTKHRIRRRALPHCIHTSGWARAPARLLSWWKRHTMMKEYTTTNGNILTMISSWNKPPRNENNNEFRCARLCEFEYTKLSHYQEHCYYNAPIIILLSSNLKMEQLSTTKLFQCFFSHFFCYCCCYYLSFFALLYLNGE